MHGLRVSRRVTDRRVRHLHDVPKIPAMTPSRYRPRRLTLANGREVTLRAIRESDAAEIAAAFERLSADSRYARFMHHKKQLDPAALQRGVRPRPGVAFAFVATVPSPDGYDIVGAPSTCRCVKAIAAPANSRSRWSTSGMASGSPPSFSPAWYDGRGTTATERSKAGSWPRIWRCWRWRAGSSSRSNRGPRTSACCACGVRCGELPR